MSPTSDEYTNEEFESLIEIGGMLFDKAEELYIKAHCKKDFCIQYVGNAQVVFGGFNRLMWRADFGFWFRYKEVSASFARSMEKLHIKGLI